MSVELSEVIASRYWREGDAHAVIQAWRASGLSAAEFGRRHGLGVRRLLRWAKVVNSAEPAAPPMSFVELAVGQRCRATAPLEVVVGSVTVRVPASFDPSQLAAVVRLLQSIAC